MASGTRRAPASASPLEGESRVVRARAALADANREVGLVVPSGTGLRAFVATGFSALDTALEGGLPRGRLVELHGGRSSGRLSLALWCCVKAIRAGECAAFIDGPDALEPRVLPEDTREQVLWARAGSWLPALQAADVVLEGGGFALVVLYLVGVSPARSAQRGDARSLWLRLLRRAEHARAAVLVVLGNEQRASGPGAFAHATLELRKLRARWHGKKRLEMLSGELWLTRGRAAPGKYETVQLRAE